jgi:peroxiredoxin
MRAGSWLFIGVLVALVAGTAATVAAVETGGRAPELGERSLGGQPIRMADLRGKVVIVDFWASWCEPCREEMPVLERLHRRYRERGLVVVGVSVDRTERNARAFLRRTRVSFPIIHDASHRIANRYSPPKMPSSYIIDRRGIIRHIHEGFQPSDAQRIEREVRALLQERPRGRRRR